MAAVLASPQQLGRFALLKVLGQGAQGTVYLAQDPRLGRQVALKTFRAGRDAESARQVASLMDEARLVSKLSHPNVVTLYDAFEDDGQVGLVFEYVPGRTLADVLAQEGALAPERAVRIALEVARAVQAAHDAGVIHRDLKPGNIMLTPQGVARVMDFGIARLVQEGRPRDAADQGLVGTPQYMAPEYLSSRTPAASNDLFALGLVLHEMLTGQPAVKGRSLFETLHHIANEPIPPVHARAACDEKLNAAVMAALERDPGRRPPDIAAFATSLKACLDMDSAPDLGNVSNATLEFLLRRMRHKSDFPALSSTLSAVNRAVNSEREPISVLCNSILKDFALTNKLLKLVNAACFTQYGGNISTVSRAVALIGFEGVRNAALSLMLFEHLQHHPHAGALKDEVLATYMTGLLARDLAGACGLRLGEEAYVCAMFHRLGELLTSFYLPEEDAAIKRLMTGRELSRDRAAGEVLGMSFEELGLGVARSWNFPDSILDSMRPVKDGSVHSGSLRSEPLRILSAMAGELCDSARAEDMNGLSRCLDNVQRKYSQAVPLDRSRLESTLLASVEALREDRDLMAFTGGKTQAFPALRGLEQKGQPSSAGGVTASPATDTRGILTPDTLLQSPQSSAAYDTQGQVRPGQRAAVLTAGVQDITNTLVGNFELFDVMRIILETLYRGLGFHRTLLFIRDPKGQSLQCRFGFGQDADALVKRRLAIPLTGSRDLFTAALQKGVDVCIDNLQEPRMQPHVPDWYRKSVNAGGLVLFPMSLNQRVVGLIYGDAGTPDSFRFSPEELNLMKTLRNQAVLALKQRSV